MSWKITKNNEKLISKIRNSIIDNRISHAYIFEGDSNTDKISFTNDFLKALFCKEMPGEGCEDCVYCRKISHNTYEDVVIISGSGVTNSIRDDLVEETLTKLKTKPDIERNVLVINDADNLTVRSQNHLLKTLEEPPGESIIILLSENINNLLPTVNSRCIKFRLPDDADGYNKDISELEMPGGSVIPEIVEMTVGGAPFYKIKSGIEEVAKDRNTALCYLDCLERKFEEILRQEGYKGYKSTYSNDDISRVIYEIEKTRREIQLGGSRPYSLKKMILKIRG